jgi:hypothetical protein
MVHFQESTRVPRCENNVKAIASTTTNGSTAGSNGLQIQELTRVTSCICENNTSGSAYSGATTAGSNGFRLATFSASTFRGASESTTTGGTSEGGKGLSVAAAALADLIMGGTFSDL